MPATRRSFLGAAAAAALAPALPRTWRRPLRLMVIGVGGRGQANLEGVAGEQVDVLCDVDEQLLQKAAARFPAARTCVDYREVLTDARQCERLDGVVVSTPDHTHYGPAMLAVEAGLDLYCEKPLTQTVAQARRLTRAAAARGVVTQMGIQIHANENFRRVVEAVRHGACGTIREVLVFVNGTDWSAGQLPAPSAPPAHLHWDLWLGPAAPRPYAADYHPAGWRRYWAFGGGTTADMACHYLDLAFWALSLDAPTTVLADGPEPHAECAPGGMRCSFAFPRRDDRPALVLHWHAGADRPAAALRARGLDEWRNGVLFVGDDGWLVSDYNRHLVGPDARRARWQAPTASIPPSPGHHKEWLDACRNRTQPSCSFAYAGPLTETALLANVAFRAARGRRLDWRARELSTGDAAADAMLDVAPRAGW